MAKSNGFNAMFSIEFESFDSVRKKLDTLQGKLNNELKNGAKIDLKIDTTQITKIMKDLSNLAKNEIKIMPNGEITTLSKFNDELGKTITLKQNLSKNETTIGISNDEEKKLREYTKLFDQAIKQEGELNKVKQSQRDSEWKEMETSYKQEQQFINASQSLKQKASQQSRANAEAESKISNKLLEDQYKQNQSQKQEMEDAQKLIAYEKQRLDIKLKSINANRGSLVDENYSAKIQDSISGLNGKSVDEVRTKTKQLNLELQKLDQQARMNGLQVGNKNIMSFGESIKSTATKLGIFASTAMVLNQVGVQFRNATDYVVKLDSAMIGLKKVTDETNATYSNFLNNMHNVAMQFGTQSNYMVNAVENWAKTGKTLEEASKLAENTILLTKVGDVQSVDTAQQYMIAPLKAFNIEAEKSIELIDKYNNISNNMSTTVADVGDALSQSASSMSTAGNSLEQTIAMIAAAESATKLGGNAIGNALKTMSMRLATFKDDETGEVIPKMAEQLKELTNVDITDINGQLRNTYDIYMEIGKVYKDLDKNSQLQINEVLGGKRQGNIVGAILADTDGLKRAFDLASNSAGSAMKEFETYQDGIQYSIDVLKEQINGLYTSFIKGGFVKGFVDGSADIIGTINTVTSSLGTIPTVITTVVGAMTLFNSKFRESSQMMSSFIPSVNKVFTALNTVSTSFGTQASVYSAQIAKIKALTLEYQKAGMSTGGFGKTLLGLNTKLALSTSAMIATKVAAIALQAAMSAALTLGVSMLISGLTKLSGQLIDTGKELKDFNDEYSQTGNNSSDFDYLISKYEVLDDKLKEATKGSQEYKDIENELNDIQNTLISTYSDKISFIDKDSESKKININATKELNEQESILAQTQAKKTMSKNNIGNIDDIDKAIGKYEEYFNILDKWNEKDNTHILSNLGEVGGLDASFIETLKTGGDLLPILEGNAEECKAQLEALYIATGTMAAEDEKWLDAHEKLGIALGMTKEEIDKTTESVENLSGAVDGLNNEGAIELLSVEDATKSYVEANSEISKLKSNIDDLVEAQEVTPKLMGQLTDTYPDIIGLGAGITDLAAVQGFLNEKIKEQAVVQGRAYQVMLEDDQAFYQQKIANGNEIQNAFDQLAAAFVDTNSDAYNFDASNFDSLNAAKSGFSGQFVGAMANFMSEFVGGSAEAYRLDLQNCKTLAQQKAYIINAMTDQLNVLQNNMNRMANTFQEVAVNSSGNAIYGRTAGALEHYNKLAGSLKTVQVGLDKVTTSFNDYDAAFSGYSGGYSGNGGYNGSGGSSGSSSKPSGSSSSSSSEKEVSDINIKTDRYYKLNDVLDDYNNLLEKNKNAQEYANPTQLNKLIAEEISLMEKKKNTLKELQRAYEDEQSSIKKSLQQDGFLFDSYGNLANSQERLLEIQNWINSSTSGDYKESQKAHLEELTTLVERFTSLANTEIPKTSAEIDSLNNSIQGIALDKLTEMREKIVDALRTSIQQDKENEIKILDDRIEALQKQLDDMDNDYEDKIKKRTKLEAELKRWEADDSIYGKKQADQIRKELEALNKEIKKDEIQLEIDKVEKEKENISEIYDKKLEEKKLYIEADRLLTEGHVEEIKKLLEGNSEDFKSLGGLLGDAFRENFMDSISLALESLKLLKGELNDLTNKNNSNTVPEVSPPPPQSAPPSNSGNSGTTSNKPVAKGSKVKVPNPSDTIYVDSYTGRGSGTWKGAGVGVNDSLYVVNDNNGKVALSRTNNINGTIGWINKSSVKAFNIGGHTGDGEGMAWLDKQERVLTANQTKSFEDLVKMLPSLINSPILKTIGLVGSNSSKVNEKNRDSGNITINNKFEIENNTPFSLERQDENITKVMKRELRRFGKIK